MLKVWSIVDSFVWYYFSQGGSFPFVSLCRSVEESYHGKSSTHVFAFVKLTEFLVVLAAASMWASYCHATHL